MAGDADALAAKAQRASAAVEAATKAAEAEEVAGKAAIAAKRRMMLPKLLHYILELARYDMDYDIRDRCRSLRAMISIAGNEENPEAEKLNSLHFFKVSRYLFASMSSILAYFYFIFLHPILAIRLEEFDLT